MRPILSNIEERQKTHLVFIKQVWSKYQKAKYFQIWLNINKYLQKGENQYWTIHNFSVRIIHKYNV